jgi:DNA-binding response OmpR family regulator
MYPPTLTFNGPSKSILIVDDNGVILDLLAVMFEKYGFKVFKAENGLDGWNLFKNKDIDFVLTDLMMPGLNGQELSTRIRKQAPFVKIGMMTGGETDFAAGLLKDGTVDYFFTKPFDIKNVCMMLTEEAPAA